MHALNDQVIAIAQQLKVTKGRKLRVNGSVVQTAIHHPTDSSLLLMYRKMVTTAQQTVAQARRIREALEDARRLAAPRVTRLRDQFDHYLPLVDRLAPYLPNSHC